MSAHLSVRSTFRSPILAICEVECRPHECGRGGEEHASTHDIVFPRRGAFVRHVSRDCALADHASIALFNADEPYRVSHPVDGGDDCTVLTFDRDTLFGALALADPSVIDRPRRPFRRAQFVPEPRLLARQRRLRRYAASASADPLTVEEESLQLLGAIAGALDAGGRGAARRRADTVDAHRDAALAVRALLVERYTENIPLRALADVVHLSPFHLSRVFRVETGVAIHQLRTRLRLAAAIERLLGGADDLTQLALDLGFSHHSHFTRAFARALGAPPSALRRPGSAAQVSKFVQAANRMRA